MLYERPSTVWGGQLKKLFDGSYYEIKKRQLGNKLWIGHSFGHWIHVVYQNEINVIIYFFAYLQRHIFSLNNSLFCFSEITYFILKWVTHSLYNESFKETIN